MKELVAAAPAFLKDLAGSTMNVAGYETGPIDCKAAFVADFDVAADIHLIDLVSKIDIDRQRMDIRPGMRSKYVPLRFDPATGAHQIGGRYLFETWDDVLEYIRFTSDLEFEPGIKFWNRPFFSNIDKRAWHVVGAYDFMPLATHYVSRFERFSYEAQTAASALAAAWPAVRDAAAARNRGSVWLLNQPDEQQIGLLTVATQSSGNNEAERASRSLAALEHAESLAGLVASQIAIRSLFDRTSLNLSLWLPHSRRADGDASIFPTFPVHPLPRSGG